MKLFLELSDAPVVRNQETRAPTQARVSFLFDGGVPNGYLFSTEGYVEHSYTG